ncbi:hypothetical protein [Agromyces indicus]|uniref:Uncharacterized protein n=1 Tax=Agromyces indicus TaxID=758919 RepID=A0ABU1FK19_9MICO|nr:hypothetical protein [Agromyces indicus]MDR5692105.1 hypothetical protein [Agromyces indicus]
MSTDTPASEPTTATVARAESGWVLRVYGADMGVISETPLAWGGVAFYQDGLDAVARAHAIPDGFAYQGASAWDRNPDGSYSAVLHRIDPRFST